MDSSVIPSTTGFLQGMPRPRRSVKNATQEVSQQADLLMLILVSISALLAFPIAWHYTDLALLHKSARQAVGLLHEPAP